MKVKELIRRLKLCDQSASMIFYYLKDANLNNCEYETLLDFDEGGENKGQGRVELTIKTENSDEMGN
tara:strand:- start:109 stop:309 length:201 start_codon:yes stop_codon:yes gene_type:complete